MNRITLRMAALAFAAAAWSAPASALDDPSFATAAVSANLQEIQIAQAGQQKGQRAEVKALADTLINDHIPAHQKAVALAAKLEQYAPTTLPSDQATVVGQLQRLSGADFDRAFVDQVISTHNAAIALFTPSASSANADVKAYASETLTALRAHLAAAQTLKAQLARP